MALKKMKERKWGFPRHIKKKPTRGLKDILTKIFEPNPEIRPKMNEIKEHFWIEKAYKKHENKIKGQVTDSPETLDTDNEEETKRSKKRQKQEKLRRLTKNIEYIKILIIFSLYFEF